ncbi:MAG: class I adenylate-forming enzyme family protein [Gammaproteobacteria bacterium]
MQLDSIADIIRVQAKKSADRKAFIEPDREWTFGQLDHATNQIANGLIESGVAVGDTVACLTRSLGACLLLSVAAAKCGAISVPLNWRLKPGELDYAIRLVDPKVLVTDASVAEGLAELALAEQMLVLHVDGKEPTTHFESWFLQQSAADPGTPIPRGSVAFCMFSSGTTGRPKAVSVTHEGVIAHIEYWTTPFGLKGTETVHLNVLPTFHVSGLVNALWVLGLGGTVVTRAAFEPTDFLNAIARYAVTDTFMVPTMLGAIIGSPAFKNTDLRSLQCIAYGGSPISLELLTRCVRTLPCDLRQVYGMTESSGCIALLQPEDHRRGLDNPEILKAAGQLGVHFEVRIVDPRSGAICDEGAVGEIWVRSCQNFDGYFKDPQATQQAFPEGRPGWYRTGDAGYLAAGLLYVNDRIKDMIITGGENVYPVEIEQVLATHPAVRDVAVIGVRDEVWGESVRACVALRSGHTASQSELIGYVRERIAHYKCPKSVVFVDDVPRNPSGKILKTVLRETYA